MRDELLFHATTREIWKESQKNGLYKPPSLESDGFIHCSRGSQLEDTVNRHFKGYQKILLLVIDLTTLDNEQIKYEEDEEIGEKFPHIYGALSINAIIDKIDIRSESNGEFKIEFHSN